MKGKNETRVCVIGAGIIGGAISEALSPLLSRDGNQEKPPES